MNYYEEFGIPRDAPAAKIRHAYKTLARVLHPDAHPDEALKAMAERQMRRLNAMLETLLDPEKRRAYDASLFDAGHRRRWVGEASIRTVTCSCAGGCK
jgi:molecular chaperone DnaJ